MSEIQDRQLHIGCWRFKIDSYPQSIKDSRSTTSRRMLQIQNRQLPTENWQIRTPDCHCLSITGLLVPDITEAYIVTRRLFCDWKSLASVAAPDSCIRCICLSATSWPWPRSKADWHQLQHFRSVKDIWWRTLCWLASALELHREVSDLIQEWLVPIFAPDITHLLSSSLSFLLWL